MLTLSKKIKEAKERKQQGDYKPPTSKNQRASIRDRLLVKEAAEIEENINAHCKVTFPDPNCLHEFSVYISPEEGMWKYGTYRFQVNVPEDYNIKPPTVKCKTRIWHPNITESGDVCLSLLRDHSLDGTGWVPTRTLKEVVWGLYALFTDLCDFDDPLNTEAADHYRKDLNSFKRKVSYYIQRYAQN